MNARLTQPIREPQLMQPVFRRLASLAVLSPEEEQLVQRLSQRSEDHSPNTFLVTEGEAVRPRFVVSGWACRQRMLPDGRRQIFSLVLPGDAIGVGAQPRPLGSASTVALTRLVTVDASGLVETLERSGVAPNLATAVRLQAGLDEALLLDHVVRLGRQTAYERVAHLLLELQSRLFTIGLADGVNFPLPLTQESLADVLGLSIVHVNRTLQQLRREKMIKLAGFKVTLLEPQLLATIADYRPPQPRIH
ncbi:MAG: Crp/Fnr family transcriptional regulator [Caulobacteraceae bacterium]